MGWHWELSSPFSNCWMLMSSLPNPTWRGFIQQELAFCSAHSWEYPMSVTAATLRCQPSPGLWLLPGSGRSSGFFALQWWRRPQPKGWEEKEVWAARHGGSQDPSPPFSPGTSREARGFTLHLPALAEVPCSLSARANVWGYTGWPNNATGADLEGREEWWGHL